MHNLSLHELAYLFLDREMDADERASFRERIEICRETRQTTHRCRRLLTVFRQRCPREHAPEQLRVRILAVIQERTDSDS